MKFCSICGVDQRESLWSPPSRGAWIEIMEPVPLATLADVAPLAGGVD